MSNFEEQADTSLRVIKVGLAIVSFGMYCLTNESPNDDIPILISCNTRQPEVFKDGIDFILSENHVFYDDVLNFLK